LSGVVAISTKQSIAAVVFDIGGVLLDWDPRHLYRKLFHDEDEMNSFLGEVCTLEWHDAHDRGKPADVSCAELAAAHPEHGELIWAWTRRSEEMIAGPIPESVELLRDLKAAGVPCYALTNMEVETYPQRLERFPFLRWFDGTVVSGFEGVAKPDVEIFELLLRRFDLAPDSTLLIDDSPRNVRAALSLGMQAVQFESASEVRQLLEEAGPLGGTG
jgi:2-haloacid dehalogenase